MIRLQIVQEELLKWFPCIHIIILILIIIIITIYAVFECVILSVCPWSSEPGSIYYTHYKVVVVVEVLE